MMKMSSLPMPKKQGSEDAFGEEPEGAEGGGAELEIEMEPKGEESEDGEGSIDLSALSDEELLKEVQARGLKLS